MKIKKIIAFLSALTLTCSVSSCTLRGMGSSSERTVKSSDSRNDRKKGSSDDNSRDKNDTPAAFNPIKNSKRLDIVRDHVDTLIGDLTVDSNEDAVQDDIDTLIADFDQLYEEYTSLTIPYYLDFDNEDLEADADDAAEDMYIAAELITFAFCKGYNSENYGDMFTSLIHDDETLEAYSDPSMDTYRIEGYTRVENWLRDEKIDRFHDAAYDEDMDDDEKNLICAEILLEILKGYDTEMFYQQYYRDYTPEDIIELSDIVREKLMPVSEEIIGEIMKMDGGMDIVTKPKKFDNPFETIAEYAGELSPEISNAAQKLLDDEEYSISDGDGSYNGSFTAYLPVSKKGVVYITDNKDYYSLLTPVHEFGHYYAQAYDHIPTYLASSNLDIAEIQSQGFECLFTRFYDDIYEDQADAMFAAKSYDLVNAVVSGFAVGEFEYTVLQNVNTFTPEDVLECWEDIVYDSLPGVELYMVNHIFESPGYYISYAVSALAAFDIWEDCLSDPDAALEKYEKIARISYNDYSYSFRSAIKEAGFNDVLNEDYINELAEKLTEYADGIQ